MPPSVSTSSFPMEKTFRRLLISTEKHLQDKSIEDWKIEQFVQTLSNMLNDMRKSINRPNSKLLDEYKQRIDRLRQNIDPLKLEDQTFPRQSSDQVSMREQSIESTTPPPPPPAAAASERARETSTRAERSRVNRQQQYIQSEEDKQDDIATSMGTTTKSILNTAQRLQDIVRDDRTKIAEAESLVDTNTARLAVQSRRLKHNAYNASNCWIYLMLIIVIVTFIYLTLFMRMFRKRTIRISPSNIGSRSSLLNQSVNDTNSNQTNITTTKSTDYISLLLNYANENHTDL